MTIKYDTQLIQTRVLFERITGAEAKDCFQHSDRLLVVVQEGQMGKALGKNKANIRRLEQLLKRKIKIVEYNPEIMAFVQNLLAPLRADKIEEADGVVTLHVNDSQTKGYIIGARAQNLRRLEETVRQYFPIKEIKVN